MYTKLNMIFYKFIMAEANSGPPKWRQYSPAGSGWLSSCCLIQNRVGTSLPGPPNSWGLRPKGPIPFTEFRASGAGHVRYLNPPNLALLGPGPIPRSPKIGGLTYPLGEFMQIFETSQKEALACVLSMQDSADNFPLWAIIGPLLSLRHAIGILVNKFLEALC